MTKKELSSVDVSFRIVLDVSMTLRGLTLETALEKARTMNVEDVVDLSELSHNDSSINVTGVSQYGGDI